jgi:hypothetical protein
MAIFGMKTKKLAKFGHKAVKAGIFGAKNGGRLAFTAGTMLGSPQLMAAGSTAMAVSQGIEKISH